MERFIIQGGHQLSGEIPVFGAKNHALKALAATLLFERAVHVENVPMGEDVLRMLDIIRTIGGSVNVSEDVVDILPPTTFDGVLPEDLVPQLRASLVLLGPLLTRFGRVLLPHPGGDNIGKRPIDFFLEFTKAMGAEVVEHDAAYEFIAPNGLQGTRYFFPVQSHTGTETMILAAAGAHGTTVIENASCEPEVVALAQWLRESGVAISGEGTQTIVIEGGDVSALEPAPAIIIPDRLEAGSFLILGAATNSELTVTGCVPGHLTSLLHAFETMGIPYSIAGDAITVHTHESLAPLQLVTHEYPGFPTDLQAPMTVLLTQATGQSAVRETIYEGRLFYTDMLNNMGAQIQMLDPYRVTVQGKTALYGKSVVSPDIRAGIAMVIAGLIATGETTIEQIYQVDRGYLQIEQRLQQIGAQIRREKR